MCFTLATWATVHFRPRGRSVALLGNYFTLDSLCVVVYFGWTGAVTPPGGGCSVADGLTLPSSSTQTHTSVHQMKPGGQTCCPLPFIYCCSKETLTADLRQVRSVFVSAAWRLFIHPHRRLVLDGNGGNVSLHPFPTFSGRLFGFVVQRTSITCKANQVYS